MTAATSPDQLRHETPSTVANGFPHLTGNGSNSGKEHVSGYITMGAQGARSPVTPPHQSLNANVTPRSGSRKHRAEVTPPHQNSFRGAESTSPLSMSIETRAQNGNVIRSPHSIKKQRSISMSSDDADVAPRASKLHERSDTSMSAPIPHHSAKFFYANDLAPVKSSPNPNSKPAVKSWASDYDTNREDFKSNGTIYNCDSPLSKPSTPPQLESRSPFFYANDMSVSRPSSNRGNLYSPPSRPPLQTIHSGHSPQMYGSYRPPSPLKEEIFPEDESDDNGMGDAASALPDGDSLSRSSSRASASPRTSNHVRKSSIPSTKARQRKSSIPQPITDAQDTTDKRVMVQSKRASLEEINLVSPKEPTRTSQSFSQPQSPSKPQKEIDRMNEMAAKARRDRKVLDLEISNSSLLAINSTLEREMRKMKGELRHYRRLSRNGKTSQQSHRLPRDSGCAPDELSSSESEDEDEVSSTLSTSQKSATGNRAALARFDDPILEPLDLSAYRMMILESRQLNQTIKRCLGQSEVMLKSGHEALEFHSRVVDGESLGPRVLSPDELGDDAIERRQGLLTPTLPVDNQSKNPWERSLENYGQSRPSIHNQPNLEALAKLNNTPLHTDTTPKAEGERPHSQSSTSDENPGPPDQLSYDYKSNKESLLSVGADGGLSSIASGPPAETALANMSNEFVRSDDIMEAPMLSSQPPSAQAIDPALVPVAKRNEKETIEQRDDKFGNVEPNQSAPADTENSRTLVPPAPSPDALSASNSPPPDNAPANRGSITKYLSSFWATASTLRPPG